MFELVVIWWNGEKDIFEYDTREEAEQGGRNIKTACGNQVEWYGVRPKYF